MLSIYIIVLKRASIFFIQPPLRGWAPDLALRLTVFVFADGFFFFPVGTWAFGFTGTAPASPCPLTAKGPQCGGPLDTRAPRGDVASGPPTGMFTHRPTAADGQVGRPSMKTSPLGTPAVVSLRGVVPSLRGAVARPSACGLGRWGVGQGRVNDSLVEIAILVGFRSPTGEPGNAWPDG
jgi:hypothetical protein